MSKKYYTYILTHERNHLFYVGVTNNMERRMSEHKAAPFGTHVGHYNIKKLVYFEVHSDIRIAIKREKTIKKWKKRMEEKSNNRNESGMDGFEFRLGAF